MSDTSSLKLPPLQQTELDPATLARLFSDLAQCTQVLAVVPRREARTLAPEQTISLDAAASALNAGTVRGIKIRYLYENREWTDTLLPVAPGCTRLVRICSEDILATMTSGKG
jgi:hypothetical protein